MIQWCLDPLNLILNMYQIEYPTNKLKSLKVTQVKDEIDVDEDGGCAGVCDLVSDVVW